MLIHNNSQIYDTVLEEMDRILSILVSKVPAPKQKQLSVGNSVGYRYIEKTIHQAIMLKLVRTISGLRAIRLLMEHGFVQEQASLYRMLDELHEDIMFLTFGIVFNDYTDLHCRYLEAFYKEEFDAETAIASSQNRPMIPRKIIRSYLHQKNLVNVSPNVTMEAARTISKIYSGYLHAASPQIMELYYGQPPKFHTNGILGSVLHGQYCNSIRDYMYRGILSFANASKALGEDNLCENTKIYAYGFFKNSGMS